LISRWRWEEDLEEEELEERIECVSNELHV
jgi:hypothetical protein